MAEREYLFALYVHPDPNSVTGLTGVHLAHCADVGELSRALREYAGDERVTLLRDRFLKVLALEMSGKWWQVTFDPKTSRYSIDGEPQYGTELDVAGQLFQLRATHTRECAHCRGTGEYWQEPNRPCTWCWGTGKHNGDRERAVLNEFNRQMGRPLQ